MNSGEMLVWNRFMRSAGRLVLSGVCALALAFLVPQTASAASRPALASNQSPALASSQTGRVMASPSVNVRSAPCVESGCAIDGQLAYGTTVTISCWLPGDMVTGWGGTSDAWDLIVSPKVNGQAGWAADVWINTGADIRTQIKPCP
jgi:hypothetical protein